MNGNDYKRLRQEEEEDENEETVFDPLLKLENDKLNNNNNNVNNYENKFNIKLNTKSFKNRLLEYALTSKSSKYSSTIPNSSILITNNNNSNSCINSDNKNTSKTNRKCQNSQQHHQQQQQQQQDHQIVDVQQSKIVRNKRCDNSTTDKKLNISENVNHLTKKKRFIVFLVFIIIIFCFNSSTIMTWTTTEKIPVLHSSHVPGMRGGGNHSSTEFHLNYDKFIDLSSNFINISNYSNTNNINSNNNDNKILQKVLNSLTTTTTTITSDLTYNNFSNLNNQKFNNNYNYDDILISNINANKSILNYNNSELINSINYNSNNSIELFEINNSSTTKNINISSDIIPVNNTPNTSTTIIASILNKTFDIHISNIKAITPPPSGYLVWSDKCKMPNLDPYSADVMKYFKRENYEECSKEQPLTSVKYNVTAKRYMLVLDEKLRDKFTRYGNQLNCCYQVIERNSTGKKADEHTQLSACLSFTKTILLPSTTDNIIVKCKSGNKQTYINGHPMMPEQPEIRERIDNWKANDTERPISVLLLGLDSISRINLIRAMPKTAQYLYDNEWFELSGYNKMDDNTFPNLMAILTGYNYTNGYQTCKPTIVGKLNDCPMIWKTFRDLGYVTAYGEDETTISTFNFLKVGFQKPPTDYYLRPFLIQAEHNFHKRLKSGLTFCLGYQHSADYVYDYALELATRYKDDPYFGLFWANTFSHNSISDCSSMDLKMVEYLEKFSNRGIVNNSVIIFFSDHGMRFGPTRKLLTGHYEERLPFMFISLPPWLKTKYPELVNALSVNKNRLTNPFDMHMTLKHILELSGRAKNLPKAPDCFNCQTLLKPVPQSRSCDEISIEDHWCTCIPYQSIYKKSNLVKKVTEFTVDYINNYVGTYKNSSISHLCGKLHIHDIIAAYRALLIGNIYPPNLESYRIVFTTNPGGGMFEATIRRYSDTELLEVTGSISRLNTYASDSKCIPDASPKKYCHCNKHPSSRAAVRSPAG